MKDGCNLEQIPVLYRHLNFHSNRSQPAAILCPCWEAVGEIIPLGCKNWKATHSFTVLLFNPMSCQRGLCKNSLRMITSRVNYSGFLLQSSNNLGHKLVDGYTYFCFSATFQSGSTFITCSDAMIRCFNGTNFHVQLICFCPVPY